MAVRSLLEARKPAMRSKTRRRTGEAVGAERGAVNVAVGVTTSGRGRRVRAEDLRNWTDCKITVIRDADGEELETG